MFELLPTVDGLMAATNERVIRFIYLFLFVPCQQINYQAVGSMLDGVSRAGRDTKEEKSARVRVLKQLVMESGTLHTACSHLQPPRLSHSPAVTSAGLLSHL